MGAASSISNCIYISSSENDHWAANLYKNLNNNAIQCDINHFDASVLSASIESIIAKCIYIIVCINEKSLRSFHQMVEINNILDSNKKIIYVMTDANFTPLTSIHLNGFIKNNLCMNAYDEESLECTISKIKEILSNVEFTI